MDLKKIAVSLIAVSLVGTVSITTLPSNLFDGSVSVSVSAATYLKLGSTGSAVKDYQRNLIALNYLKSGSDSGTFDKATDTATKKLQSDYNLKVDGIVGSDTISLTQGLVGGSAKIIQVTGSNVNIRSGAGTKYSIMSTAQKNNKFVYKSTKKVDKTTWYCVNVKGKTGYICGSYAKVVTVKPVSTSTTVAKSTNSAGKTTSDATTTTTKATSTTPKSTSTATKATSNTVSAKGNLTVTGDKVNVRIGAGTSYPVIATVKKGSTYSYSNVKTVSGQKWYYIKISILVSGWICGSYVSVDQPAATTTAKTTTTTTAKTTTTTTAKTTTTTKTTVNNSSTADKGVVTASVLNVRKSPSTSAEVIGTLTAGQTVVVVENGDEWHKIEYGLSYGYVSSQYISFNTSGTDSEPISYSTDYYYLDKGETLNLGFAASGVTYTSSDPQKCPISSTGVVTGKVEGLYEITAKKGSSKATTCVAVLREPYTGIKAMKISSKGTNFIAECEGGGTVLPTGETVFYPYQDVSGFWTIGYGHAKTSAASKKWSEEQAIAEFNKDIEKMIGAQYKLTDDKPYLSAEGAVKLLNADMNDGTYVKAISDWAIRNGIKLNQNQFDALVSFCYNLGPAYWTSDSNKFYLKSAIISHRSGDDANPDQIIDGFCRYTKSGGKHYKGLWYRRRNEAEMFIKGDYKMERAEKFTVPNDRAWA